MTWYFCKFGASIFVQIHKYIIREMSGLESEPHAFYRIRFYLLLYYICRVSLLELIHYYSFVPRFLVQLCI